MDEIDDDKITDDDRIFDLLTLNIDSFESADDFNPVVEEFNVSKNVNLPSTLSINSDNDAIGSLNFSPFKISIPVPDENENDQITFENENDKKKGLSLQLDFGEELNKTYSISATGKFESKGFTIEEDGVKNCPKPHSTTHIEQWNQLVGLRIIGRGASGVLHLAFHKVKALIVAIKAVGMFIRKDRHQVINELKALYNEPNQHVVSFHGARTNEGKIEMVIEYMDRGSLEDIVTAVGKIPEAVLKELAKQVMLGLKVLHGRKQVHRDIKPANLILNHHGQIKIGDFGIAVELDTNDLMCATVCGTTRYMSPERIKSEPYSYPCDVWAVGVSFYYAASGLYAYNDNEGYFGLYQKIIHDPTPQLSEEFSPEFRDWVNKCLIKNPNARATSQELLDHPWIKDVPEESSQATIDLINNYMGDYLEKRDLKDLREILKIVCDTYYRETDFKNSLFENSKLEMIGSQIGISFSKVKREFDSIYEDFKKKTLDPY